MFKILFVASCLLVGSHAWNKDMEVDGLFEGDIQVTPEQMDRLQKGANEFGSIIGGRWPGGKIPYVIESSIGSSGRQQIQLALQEYHAKTCLRFSPRTNEQYYISFYNGQGCSSPVGRTGRNRISLQAPGCQNKGTILHEIGHSIGLLHEQSRPDRDQYVTINYHNLFNQQVAYNFQKASNVNSLGTPYDLHSMMHYSSTAFARAGTRTIVTKDRSKQSIIDTNNRISGFSEIDIKQINLMYKNECGGGSGGNGGNGGGNNNCQDKDGNCASWAQQGYCSNSQHGPWMKSNCCKSCTGTGGGSTCAGDRHQYCSTWAARGYCTSQQHLTYMRQNCCKSCRF
ncbi:astacin-like [Clytia hemisphaerica]|uniref:Metalloendopeptidase n=1 Tax=Clytia hemisphaerica TaxID=252671 RepID=A0A7M5UPW4_9CNID